MNLRVFFIYTRRWVSDGYGRGSGAIFSVFLWFSIFFSPQKMNLRQSLKMAKAMSASRRIMPSIWARSMNFSLGLRRVATS